MRITYLGHACFCIESCGYSVILDPYTNVEGYSELSLSANEVHCSHSHLDHAYTDAVKLIGSGMQSPFSVGKIDCFHDDKEGSLRGPNKVTVLEADGKRIAHLGDIGHMPDDAMREKLLNLDCLLIPIGGFFTIDARQAIDIISMLDPRLVIPMHYRDGSIGLAPIGTIDEFLELCPDNIKSRLRLVRGYGQCIEL